MIFSSAGRLQLVFYVSTGLLSLLSLSECEQVRLVGPSRCSGRVEIFHMNVWGTVCDDLWNLANAEVVCREIGCGTALDAKKGAFFGEGRNQIWLDDVQCTGSENTILKCPHKPLGVNNCGHSEDAGVVCSDHLKVVNGSNRCNGRVETYRDGQWKRVCNTEWRKNEADVVCQEMNCGTSVTQTEASYFGEAQGLPEVKVTCVGNETSISHCHLAESREHCIDATVLCSNTKPIRLINGTNRCTGRVEVYYGGQWGTICDDRWGMPEARVTCREVNCGTPLSVKYKAFYGRGGDQIWLDDVECSGEEKSLSDCPHRAFGEHDCDHAEDAGVECSENIRLINGTDRCSGRLEIFHNNQWVKVCNSNWDLNRAKMVCQELDCGAPKTAQGSTSYGFSKLTGFTSSCSSQATTFNQCTFQEVTAGCEDVSISCAGNPPLRLANGTDRCSGRVEVLHDSMWGTVCDDAWDINEAQVVCRTLDCGTAISAKSSAYFGQGQGDVWLDDMGCVGNETSLLHCPHPPLGNANCGHGEDAGVVCSVTTRLINGTNQCSGKLEYHRGDRWSPAFFVNWGMNEARVVCREMACGDAVQTSGSPGQGGTQRGLKITCSGRESALADCMLRDYTTRSNERLDEAFIECSGNVRLAGGPNRCAGRVEFFDKGQWGKICGTAWDLNDATVVCKQLGCGRAHKITTMTEHGEGPARTWIDILGCNGMESTLAQCSHMQFTDDRTCNITSIAGVVCAGSLDVRLANKDSCAGRVEVRQGDVWKTVCDADWTLSKAEVVCQHLECGHAVNAPGSAHFGQGIGPVVEASNNCFDNQTFLQKCSVSGFRSSSCGHERDASVICAAPVRLVGGGRTCSGRVEIFYKGLWGTVCDDEWEMPNADVVCKQLGCGHAVSAPMSAHFGRGTGPIWLDNVECTGQEFALSECRHAGVGENNCGHGEDASAICLGALEKPQITLSPGPEVSFGDKVEITCTLVAEHLGGTFILKRSQDAFQMEKYSDNEAATFTFPVVRFDQKGSYFCEYQKKLSNQIIYYPQGNPADLSVTVKLEKPGISLTSPYAMVVYSPDKISVNDGNSFSVTCSIHSRYPGGVFYLTQNNLTSQMKEAFGHTIFYLATFEFPKLLVKDQGDYTCVYKVNISSVPFCSDPSKKLQVTVIAASSSSATVGVVIGLLLVVAVAVIGYFAWKRKWRAPGTIVQFMNRFGETIKHDDIDDRSNGLFDGRERTNQVTEQPQTRLPQEKIVEFDADNPAERAPEDLAGRVCYELEPLVLS